MVEDAVKVAPHAYKVVVENDKVRVLEYRGTPGVKTEMHSHPAVVAIAIGGGKFKFTLPGGQSMEIELEQGHAMYMDASEHATENIGTSEGHIILVELK
jgi:quercetin dioxygenase-like cupin family protein